MPLQVGPHMRYGESAVCGRYAWHVGKKPLRRRSPCAGWGTASRFAMEWPPIRCGCTPGSRSAAGRSPSPTTSPTTPLSRSLMSETNPPVLWARADGIALGALRADLAHEYWRWESDPGAVLGYGRQVPESPESRAQGLEHPLRGAPDQAPPSPATTLNGHASRAALPCSPSTTSVRATRPRAGW